MNAWLRFPAVRGDSLCFVHDDDVWSVPLAGGRAQRLSTLRVPPSWLRFSADGQTLYYLASDEGSRDVWAMSAHGGLPRRLTHQGDITTLSGVDPNNGWIVGSTAHGQPFAHDRILVAFNPEGGPSVNLNLGPGMALSWQPGGSGRVLGRFASDPARWKGYRGGRQGDLWVDRTGSGPFERLVELDSNLAHPMWIGERIWFVSDHEGAGNIYSVDAHGNDLQQHTKHEGFYVRHPSTDGDSIVYMRAGSLHHLDPKTGADQMVAIDIDASATSMRPRFVETRRYRTCQDIHPNGEDIGVVVRGKATRMGAWHGPVRAMPTEGGRHRLLRWLPEGDRCVVASDQGGEDGLDVLEDGTARPLTREVGRVVDLAVDPTGARVAVANHRQEVLVIDLSDGSAQRIDQSTRGPIAGMDWSHDGQWLAWSRPEGASMSRARVMLWSVESNEVTPVTDGRHFDWCPSFSPDGDLLFFLARRDFNSVYDSVYFDVNFPKGSRPWAATLRTNVPHPFRRKPVDIARAPKPKRPAKKPRKLKIDLEGLSERILPMPVKESIYQKLVALPGGNVLLTRKGPSSNRRKWWDSGPPAADLSLVLWEQHRRELVLVDDRVSAFGVDLKRQRAWVVAGWRLRLIPASAEKGRREELKKRRGEAPSRASAWVDLDRVRIEVNPAVEWLQIFEESWRLARDYFWRADMGDVDWQAVRERYRPLLAGVRTRDELTDLLWTMQGELGVSHAYVMGGDTKRAPSWSSGKLAADLVWRKRGWTLTHICVGDPGHRNGCSPLADPGVNAKVGERLVAVDGVALTREFGVDHALRNRGDQLVALTLATPRGRTREVVVRLLRDDRRARYRDWVRRNRELVHKKTKGRCGYVHIPNMGPDGYADFHRDFLAESAMDALIVDVRYNGGGHVSQLLLEKVARRPIAWHVSRHSGPSPYPDYAVAGPRICLTNRFAGSDGDNFSHHWKQLELGPLVGTRTWGGVIGIWPRNRLVDRGLTTQPEFMNTMRDVGEQVEGYGTDPDVHIDRTPDDWAAKKDPVLDHGIRWVTDALKGFQDPTPDWPVGKQPD